MEGDKVFYLSPTNLRGKRRMLIYTMTLGMNTSSLRMINLRRCYRTTQTLCASPKKMFFVWDENYRIQA
jgi:hypothetical protein